MLVIFETGGFEPGVKE